MKYLFFIPLLRRKKIQIYPYIKPPTKGGFIINVYFMIHIPIALTYNDVLIIPKKSTLSSRSESQYLKQG